MLVIGARCTRLARRNVDALLEALILPIMVMLVFVYLFGGAIRVHGDYVNYVVPGVLVLCAAFGSAFTAVSVNGDIAGQIIDRFRSLDVSGVAILGGHVIASLVRNGLSLVVVFAISFVVGFRPSAAPGDVVLALVVLLLFIGAFSWLSAAVGVLLRSPEAATGFSFFAFFLVNPSSALVPVSTMPSWVQPFARDQPVSAVVDATRSLLLGTGTGSVMLAVMWCLGIGVASAALSHVAFQRRTR